MKDSQEQVETVVGGYRIIGPHAESVNNPKTLILDTNTLIDMKNFYFKGPSNRYSGLEELLLHYPFHNSRSVDINFGWAVAEATWPRGEDINLEKRREFIHAASTIVNWTPAMVSKNFSNRHAPVNRDRKWPNIALPKADEVPDCRLLLATHYGSLLYLLDLYNRRRAWVKQNSTEALRQYYSWVSEVLGTRDSYSTAIAIALLCGSTEEREKANRIFKLSGNETNNEIAKKCWNVAWDMVMTSLAEGISYGLLPGARPEPACLVTKDSDPMSLRNSAEMKMLIDSGSSQMPFSMISYDLKKGVETSEVEDIVEFNPLESMSRLSRSPDALKDQAFNAVDNLEIEMGLDRYFLHNSSD